MSLREELIREIEDTPDELLGEVIDHVRSLRHRRRESDEKETKLRAYRVWAGHLDLPPLPADAFDREALEREAS